MKIEFKWETIDDRTWRSKVIGGWLVKDMFNDADGNSVSTVFIPDPNHEWEIE